MSISFREPASDTDTWTIVVFPDMVAPLFVGRDKSVRALEMVEEGENEIMLVAQRDASTDDPVADDIHSVGTIASILQLLKLPDGTVKVLVEGTSRAVIQSYTENDAYFEATIEQVDEEIGASDEVEALARSAVTQFESYVKLNKKISPDAMRWC
ncbi:MAG: LON peptidase substrate-binding domain-containing protein, partial [Pseudomonadota bacterium]